MDGATLKAYFGKSGAATIKCTVTPSNTAAAIFTISRDITVGKPTFTDVPNVDGEY